VVKKRAFTPEESLFLIKTLLEFNQATVNKPLSYYSDFGNMRYYSTIVSAIAILPLTKVIPLIG
jgi:hypothetical protein